MLAGSPERALLFLRMSTLSIRKMTFARKVQMLPSKMYQFIPFELVGVYRIPHAFGAANPERFGNDSLTSRQGVTVPSPGKLQCCQPLHLA